MKIIFFQGAIFCAISMIFVVAEAFWSSRKIQFKNILALDIFAGITAGVLYSISGYLLEDLYRVYLFYDQLEHIPVFLRIIFYYLLADFGGYWIHRLMHTKLVWRSHWWHHAPKHMYWLAGVRGSAVQMALTSMPVIIAWPLLFDLPNWFYWFLLSEFIFRNHWMHVNIAFQSKWIELIFITPAYHRVHHSSSPQYQNKNFAVLFTFWDKIFGTYIDPATIDSNKKVGINESRNLVKMVLGI